tara:strand:- start:2951 stop:3979 length:1029 start_codon:yes stop_codon:yes gene_type:complete
MAFLDNSGDIILDAVLTDLGRQRMAQGNFRISKFALGDDEIGYNLYNKDHPSGSAYYDLEILQTPIFEAFTATNANINYGLLSYTKTDLLYLPELVTNEICADQPWTKSGGIYWMPANTETNSALKSDDALGDNKYTARSGVTSGYKIIIESGFDTTDLVGDSATRNSYIVSNNLVDSRFNVYFDNRFIVSCQGPKASAVFKNDSNGADEVSFGTLLSVAASSTAGLMDNYSVASIRGIPDEVYYYAGAEAADTAVSALAGPRGAATAVAFTADTGMTATVAGTRSTKYDLYGTVGAAGTTFGWSGTPGGYTYDYLDTTVLVQGTTTGMQLQLPVRLIRRAT